MRAACLAPSFQLKRGEMGGGWKQADSSHFNEKFSLLWDTTVCTSAITCHGDTGGCCCKGSMFVIIGFSSFFLPVWNGAATDREKC